MTDIVIKAENLGKMYTIGHQAERSGYMALRDVLMQNARTLWNKTKDLATGKAIIQGDTLEEVWALKNVSFEIKRGEAVGIIGRNGAGKSTLLKILSRITEPSTGRVTIKGRMASLLEVGTGFHPELSGRENIYLNGAILGMTRAEIKRKFDEIVAFAEVDKFLDTPVKRYSSGMYIRLAFAVAAHLEPEILIVDEVLAVGDAEFQRKCLGKMEDVSKEGRTVLFVSHNMGAISKLCQRSILLVDGKKRLDNLSIDVISQYINLGSEGQGERVWASSKTAPGNDKVRLRAVRIVSDNTMTADVDIQKDILVEVEYWNLKPGTRISVSIHLLEKMGIEVLASANLHSTNLVRDEWFGKPYPPGLFRTTCVLPGNFLNEGHYKINVILLTDVSSVELIERDVVSFTIHDTGVMRQEYTGGWLGVVRPRLAWQTQHLNTLVSMEEKRKDV
jgi:lipopolysaccharide transport system ATP-binding protein